MLKWKKYTSDAFGNLVQVNEPNPAGGADLVTTYTYNALNRLTGVSMTRGATTQTRTWTYDSTTQRLSSVTQPETGTVNYVYNADGTLWKRTDAKGQLTAYQYDDKQRVTGIRHYPDGVNEAVCQAVTLGYDTPPSQPQPAFIANAAGRLSSASYQNCQTLMTYSEKYSYTAGGLVTAKRFATGNGNNYDATYTYNNEGIMTSVTYPPSWANNSGTWTQVPGAKYTYTLDAAMRPTKLTDNDATRPVDWVKDVLYAANGRYTQM